MKFQNLKGNLMSNKEDNIEDLEIELKELKKKKLQKEISRLEDELNNLDTNYQPKKETLKKPTFPMILILVVVFLAIGSYFGFEIPFNEESIDLDASDSNKPKDILYRLTCEFINGPDEVGEIEIIYEIINNSYKRVENIELMVTPRIGILTPTQTFVEPGNSLKNTIQITTGDWSTHTVFLYTDSQISNATRLTRNKCQTTYEPNS